MHTSIYNGVIVLKPVLPRIEIEKSNFYHKSLLNECMGIYNSTC